MLLSGIKYLANLKLNPFEKKHTSKELLEKINKSKGIKEPLKGWRGNKIWLELVRKKEYFDSDDKKHIESEQSASLTFAISPIPEYHEGVQKFTTVMYPGKNVFNEMYDENREKYPWLHEYITDGIIDEYPPNRSVEDFENFILAVMKRIRNIYDNINDNNYTEYTNGEEILEIKKKNGYKDLFKIYEAPILLYLN